MKTVEPTDILDYYDGVLLFEARDPLGGHYIGAAAEPKDGYDRFVVTGVRPERLREFRAGAVDLRTLMLESPWGEWYIALTNGDPGESLVLEPQEGNLADTTGLLPLEGYTLDDGPIDDPVLQQAHDRNNVVLEFSVEPPEAARGHRVGMAALGRLLLQMQSVVKYACLSAVRDLSFRDRNAFDARDGYLMDVVVPAAPGSYRVILEAAKPPDKFGYGGLDLGLQRLDEVFACAGDPGLALESLQKHKGQLASSYIKLMQFLSDNDTGLSYSWAYPGLEAASYGGVSVADARRLASTLSGVTSRVTEFVMLEGEFERVNRRRGDWGLLTDNGGVKTGKIAAEGPELDGLEVGKRYRFQCEKATELVAGRERQTLYLVRVESA